MTLLLDSYFLKPSGNVETRAILADAWKVTVADNGDGRVLPVKVFHILGHRALLICRARVRSMLVIPGASADIDNMPAG